MRRLIALVAVWFLLLGSASAMNGQVLMEYLCQHSSSGQCDGKDANGNPIRSAEARNHYYAVGYLSGVLESRRLGDECRTFILTQDRMIKIFTKWMFSHTDQWRMPANGLAHRAFAEGIPCNQ